MGFIIKDTITNTETEKTVVFYTGTDGYVHNFPEYAEPYKRRCNAVKRIEKDINWFGNKINDTECIENSCWHHKFEIVEIKGE